MGRVLVADARRSLDEVLELINTGKGPFGRDLADLFGGR
jgi:hypothetical protein